ncbi:MAG: glycosyltransferase [Rhizomicrobium sp.]|jgi:hopene-associated glycosyltransferase HpnB
MMWLALLPVAAWIYLLTARGMFWLMRERDDRDVPQQDPVMWPSVTALVPARNEADVIATTLGSLLAQDYPGQFKIMLIDDQSTDGTAEAVARSAAGRATILSGSARPPGWTGKLWAMQQGLERALQDGSPDYLLFTDADIAHARDNLRALVARAEADRLVLVSLMAKLYCRSLAETILIPAFVFFFDMLFPFAWSNDPLRSTAAAAGGCMLARRDALLAAGGIEAIRREIIDDCALARIMKRQGPIWLGLTERAKSIRPYGGMDDIRRMVARSAYAQLGYSPLVLAGTVLGMVLVYAAAPLLAAFGSGLVRIEGIATWALMALAFQPMLRFYRLSPIWGLFLPVIGALYTVFTMDSALQVWRGKGGMWKGRAQAGA